MKKDSLNQIFKNIIAAVICAVVLLPFVLVVSVSFTNERALADFGYKLWPAKLDLAAYRYIFRNPGTIIEAYKVTFIFSVATMALGVLLMAMFAYPLTRKSLKGRRGISFFLYFTMLFNGGLVPTYILITKYLNLGDSIWVYILPGIISPWYVFMIRTFFDGIPFSLVESAVIDGASEYTVFFRIILPLSKAVLSTVALFTFLGKWNDWYTAMLYINEESLVSLQYLLQRIMNNIKLLQESNQNFSVLMSASEIPSESVRMAMAVIVAGPALVVFPFFQKYFVKGVTVGSVKG